MKKVRGYRRKLRRLQHQSATPATLDVGRLRDCHYDYAKAEIGSWQRHRQPLPRVVRELAAIQLLGTFFKWRPLLQQQAEPFYLAVWLTEADFTYDTQVIAAIKERISWYSSAPDPNGPPLPAEYQTLPGAAQLLWTAHPHEQWLDVLDYPSGWPSRLLRRPHCLHTAADGTRYLVVQIGWIWVGQWPTT